MRISCIGGFYVNHMDADAGKAECTSSTCGTASRSHGRWACRWSPGSLAESEPGSGGIAAAVPRDLERARPLRRGPTASKSPSSTARWAPFHSPFGGINCICTPAMWEQCFNEVPSPAIGIEWDASHLMCQFIDPLVNLRQWGSKVFHVHAKDTKIYRDIVDRYGIYHPGAVEHCFVGLGDASWPQIVKELVRAGYRGDLNIEGWHDRVFRDHDKARKFEDWGLLIAQRHLSAYVRRSAEHAETAESTEKKNLRKDLFSASLRSSCANQCNGVKPSLATSESLTLQPALRWQQQMPNLHLLRQTIDKQVAAAPADLIVLPEVFNGVHADLDPAAGPQARQFLSTLAKACNAAVVGGSIDYQHPDTHRRNTCWLIDRDGQEIGMYCKRVMFGAEQADRRPGDEAGIFELEGIRVAVLICGDMWDPALARELVGRADLLVVPAKTTVPTLAYADYARRLWWNLALTRAMENGLAHRGQRLGRRPARVHRPGRRHPHQERPLHQVGGGAYRSWQTPELRRPSDHAAGRSPGLLAATIDLDAARAYQEYRQSVGLLPVHGGR